MKIILQILLLFSSAKSFCLVPKFRDFGLCLTTPLISSRTHIFNMDYSQYKSFDDVINILPEFHTRIIINNWIKYITPDDNSIDELILDYERIYNKENKSNEEEEHIKYFPEYLIKSLYDFKIFIAINRDEKNLIYFGWCPDAKNSRRSNIAYLIAGKVYNNTINIHRMAQNPYYENILDLNSIDLVKRLEDIDYRDGEKFKFNYDTLHEYDDRYKISWDFYKN